MGSRRKGGRNARLAALRARAERPDAPGYRRHHTAAERVDHVLFLCCGALARDIIAIAEKNGWDHIDVRGLPARLHNEPHKIAGLLRKWVEIARPRYGDRIFVGYGDCGTAGEIDRLCRDEHLRRIPGPHCYSILSGNDGFMEALDDNATTYYLTDFLVDHFDAVVTKDLWLDRHPELVELMFGHYTRLVYLAQTDDLGKDDKARRIAERLHLDYERKPVGRGDLETFVREAATGIRAVGG